MSEANFFSPLEQAYLNFDQMRPIEPNGLELLHTLALLEYRNGEEKWRQPHPILKKLLERPRVEQP